MTTSETHPGVQAGDPAPDFTLPAAHGEGSVSLSSYRGRTPVLLTLLRGLYCPFCRRHVAHLGTLAPKLEAEGVALVGVVATTPERARLYFRFRPPRFSMAADPQLSTHRTFGLPNVPVTRELVGIAQSAAARDLRAANQAVPAENPLGALGSLDGFEPTEADQADFQRPQAQLCGQFLVDRAGVVRWANVECANGPETFGQMPTDEELLGAARALR
jgi:peroxiredoxin